MLPSNYQESLICIEKACQIAGLSFNYQDHDQVLAEVEYPSREKIFFIHNKNPFNNYTSARICQDKSFQADLYRQNKILHPKTKSYFNPNLPSSLNQYKSHTNIKSIEADIFKNFSFPLFLKKNISSLSKDVHLVEDSSQLSKLLVQYFEDTNDIIVIQKPIYGQEYRVVSWKGEALLAYKKGNKFSSDINIAEKVNPVKFQQLTQSIHRSLNINFFGADIIDSNGRLYLIETNPNPACFYYNKYNGREDFTQVYLRCLQEYQS